MRPAAPIVALPAQQIFLLDKAAPPLAHTGRHIRKQTTQPRQNQNRVKTAPRCQGSGPWPRPRACAARQASRHRPVPSLPQSGRPGRCRRCALPTRSCPQCWRKPRRMRPGSMAAPPTAPCSQMCPARSRDGVCVWWSVGWGGWVGMQERRPAALPPPALPPAALPPPALPPAALPPPALPPAALPLRWRARLLVCSGGLLHGGRLAALGGRSDHAAGAGGAHGRNAPCSSAPVLVCPRATRSSQLATRAAPQPGEPSTGCSRERAHALTGARHLGAGRALAWSHLPCLRLEAARARLHKAVAAGHGARHRLRGSAAGDGHLPARAGGEG